MYAKLYTVRRLVGTGYTVLYVAKLQQIGLHKR